MCVHACAGACRGQEWVLDLLQLQFQGWHDAGDLSSGPLGEPEALLTAESSLQSELSMLTFRNQSRCNSGGWWKYLPPRSEVLITQYQNIIYICQILSQFHFQYSLKYILLNLTLKLNFHKRQCSNACAPHTPSIKSRTMKICHTIQFEARWNDFRVHFIFKFKYSCVIKAYFCKIPDFLETCKHNY